MPDELSVDFRFTAGWSALTLTIGPISRTFQATAINDAFGALAEAVAELAAVEHETRLQAVLWGDEPGGVFLDFATVAPDHLALVVHSMADPHWLVGIDAPDWMPIRGSVLFTHLAPRKDLVAAFSDGFTEVRELSAADGCVEGWGHPYPTTPVSRIRSVLDA